MKRKKCPIGFVIAAFGLGLLLGYCFPGKCLIIVLAIGFIAAGILISKS